MISQCIFRLFILLLVVEQAAFAADKSTDDNVWSALQTGQHVVLIRHAITDPGIGDPPGFVIGNCSTQRNLSAQGRSDAKRIGEAFRSRNIPISDVLSSRWCRCLDTANLAFGRATPAPMLDSMFNDNEKPAEEKVREVLSAVRRRPSHGNLVLVTHNQNIQALTGVSVASGEMVVVTPENGKLRVIGRLNIPG
jgi:broad specificity phosphatase PhoE